MAGKYLLFLKSDPHYRRDAFESGLRACGFSQASSADELQDGDVAVFWNLHRGDTEVVANRLRDRGCSVIVAENGYAGSDENGHQLYALALDGHNGSGRWHIGLSSRLSVADIGKPRPWKRPQGNEPFLICGQRGIGSSKMASPPGWHHAVERELQAAGVPYVVRPHPGNNQQEKATLDSQLLQSRGVIIWSSGAGVRALLLGIPVWYAAPHWICEQAATKYQGVASLARRLTDDDARDRALMAMSWAQWRLCEIASGEAFAVLLSTDESLFACATGRSRV